MDWTTQAEEMIRTWTRAQQQMWESWLRVMQRGATAQPTEAWGQAVEAWQGAVEQALAAQGALTQRLADKMAAGTEIPKELAEWPRQSLELMQRWTEAQKPLWENWFAALKQSDPSELAKTWRAETQQVVQAWQEAAQQALEAQQEWQRGWTAALATPLPEPVSQKEMVTLGPNTSFYFRGPEDRLNLPAENLAQFILRAKQVDDATWQYHLRQGDYTHWFRTVLKDEELAAAAAQLERADASPQESRARMRELIEQRYALQA